MTDAPLTRASSIFSPAVVSQLSAIETAFGGRDQVIAILACAPKSPALDYLLGVLQRDLDQSLADLCVAAHVRPDELLGQLAQGNNTLARSMASIAMPTHLPQTVEGLMAISHPYDAPCTDCQGTGTHEGETCPWCVEGTRRYPADPRARELALKVSGLLGEGKGAFNVNVHMQQLVSTGASGGALDRLHAAADQILDDTVDLPPLEGEVANE